MKRAYQKPCFGIVKVQLMVIMAASGIDYSSDGGTGSGLLHDKEATDEGLSKQHGFSLWEDE